MHERLNDVTEPSGPTCDIRSDRADTRTELRSSSDPADGAIHPRDVLGIGTVNAGVGLNGGRTSDDLNDIIYRVRGPNAGDEGMCNVTFLGNLRGR